MIACAACAPAVMTTLSSLLPLQSCWRELKLLPDEVPPSSRKLSCTSVTSRSILWRDRLPEAGVKSRCYHENSNFLNSWFVMKATSSLAPCCYSTFGIYILIPQPTSLTSMSTAFGPRLMPKPPIRSSTLSAASVTMSVLLAKTLRSRTFKLALIYIGIFGVIVVGLFAYVHRATSSYVLSRSDRGIAAQHAGLQTAYQGAGLSGLIAAIEQSIAEQRYEGGVYLLADPSFAPVAGNLGTWPPTLMGTGGFENLGAQTLRPKAANQRLIRAEYETLPDGYHLLVGRDISDLDEFAKKITAAFALVILLLIVIAVAAAVLVTRRTVGRIEAINATTRAIMRSGLGKR